MVEVHTFNERLVNTTKVFFTIDNGSVVAVLIGNNAVPTRRGFQFYVEDYIADQIDKCELYIDGLEPKIRPKEGEVIDIPKLSDKEKRRKELLEELDGLDAE